MRRFDLPQGGALDPASLVLRQFYGALRPSRCASGGGWRLATAHRRYFTMTQEGCNSGKAISPITAVAATSSGLLTLFQRKRMPRLPAAIRIVSQSPIAILPSRT